MGTTRRENTFELIKSMSKAEKRHFKLYANRQGGEPGTIKFIRLFDAMGELDEYDEAKILKRCPDIKKKQLANLKSHLYKELLTSLRILNTRHSIPLRLKENIESARILFDKGLYGQSERILEKAASEAARLEQHSILLDIIDVNKQLNEAYVTGELTNVSLALNRHSLHIADQLRIINELSTLANRLYALHLELGYARSQKDLDLLDLYFKPKLDGYNENELSFTERFYYYQAMAWYHYVRHNFAYSYRYGRAWIELFESKPEMKNIMYDSYLRGYARLLEGMYLMRRHGLYLSTLTHFETETQTVGNINENAVMISRQILFTGHINKSILEGAFKDGLWTVRNVDSYLKRYSDRMTVHEKMMLDYKIAMLHFGDGNYAKCMEFLSGIIAVKDPRIRRDLQCYARMLNLIASYEAGIDLNLDYQIKSVFKFIVKMRDMTEMKQEIFTFLRRLNSSVDITAEFKSLYARLKPYENHPYERRTFYYLDMLSWLESKITKRSFGEIVRGKFEAIRHEESNDRKGRK